jgi:hypothetical protein
MRRKKPRRQPVHYIAFAFRDGAIVAGVPTRKYSKRRIKEEGVWIDQDLVMREGQYDVKTFERATDEQRVRMVDLLANRLNMRRTVRELVLPELANIEVSLADLHERLDRIEKSQALRQASQG